MQLVLLSDNTICINKKKEEETVDLCCKPYLQTQIMSLRVRQSVSDSNPFYDSEVQYPEFIGTFTIQPYNLLHCQTLCQTTSMYHTLMKTHLS